MPLWSARLGNLKSPVLRAPFSTTAPGLKKVSDPLKILFCGSDEFSIAALRALHQEHLRNNDLIRSLDVVVRPGKPTGRGMKTIRQVPLKSTAHELGLPVHEINTFTGWTPSFDVNLIIAVSFGLLVPSRLLRLAKYGGLNVHPSLLPDLRGPAPLHHTILKNRTHTGVTLQTLHETKFDHGAILAQTPRPGIPVPPDATLESLRNLVTAPAAEILVQGLRDGAHVPPSQPQQQPQLRPAEDVGDRSSTGDIHSFALAHAPKLTKLDRRIAWGDWTAADWLRRVHVLGPLWTEVEVEVGTKRLIFEDLDVAPFEWREVDPTCHLGSVIFLSSSQQQQQQTGQATGHDAPPSRERVRIAVPCAHDGESDTVLVPAGRGGGCLKIRTVKVEGHKSQPAARVFASLIRGAE